MTTPQPPWLSAAPAAADVPARLGARLAGALSRQSAQLPPDIQTRLRFAREQALQRARFARTATAGGSSRPLQGAAAVALAGGPTPAPRRPGWWLRTAGLLPLLVLVAGLVAIQTLRDREHVATAAAIDAELLADDLPPAAWSDPGFAEYLRSSQP
ncbi:MAG: DUF3619 family protein [Rubrivivax sp.]|nr:DUF3619 family protein [Rubrivivax sp.]